MKKIGKYIVAGALLAGSVACKDGILDTGMYDGHLPAVNFTSSALSIEENNSSALTIPLTVYGGPVVKAGSVRVRLVTGDDAVYGRDFTTIPAAEEDGSILLAIEPNQAETSFQVQVREDLESIADKVVTFNLCEGQGGVQAGGKYTCALTIVNENLTASWLTLTPSTTELADFGSVANGAMSAPQSFTLGCEGLRDGVTFTAPSGFGLSFDEAGPYGNSLYVEASDYPATPLTIWAVFKPESGMDGEKTGNIKITTTGTSGLEIAVCGTETGNSGPFYFVLPKSGDGFWNEKKSKIGNTTTMTLTPGSLFGDIYYSFDLSQLSVPVEEITRVSLMQKASADASECVVSFYAIDHWANGDEVRPVRDNYIASLTDISVNYLAETFVEIDFTDYIKSGLAAGQKVFYFGEMMKSGTAVPIYGANSNTETANNARIVVYDE